MKKTMGFARAAALFGVIICVLSFTDTIVLADNSQAQDDTGFNVEYTLIGVSAEAYEYTTDGEDYTAQFTPMDAYEMPAEITVTIGETVLGADQYEYDAQTGELTIPADVISEDVKISVQGVATERSLSNDMINRYLYIGMALCVVTGAGAAILLLTNKHLRGKI